MVNLSIYFVRIPYEVSVNAKQEVSKAANKACKCNDKFSKNKINIRTLLPLYWSFSCNKLKNCRKISFKLVKNMEQFEEIKFMNYIQIN